MDKRGGVLLVSFLIISALIISSGLIITGNLKTSTSNINGKVTTSAVSDNEMVSLNQNTLDNQPTATIQTNIGGVGGSSRKSSSSNTANGLTTRGTNTASSSAANFVIGDTIEVYDSGASGLIVRGPNACDSQIGGKFDGSRGVVLDGPVYCNSYYRWKIQWSDGTVGWSAEDWLRKVNSITLVNGIDVSHWQGSINWNNVYNAGERFAFVKASEGTGFQDPNFVTNMNNGKNAGLLVGSYHFARPDLGNNATLEARYFISVSKNYLTQGYLRPVLDLETGSSLGKTRLSNWVNEFMNTVKREAGVEPIIYVNVYYATNYLDSSVSKYTLWIAHWTYNPNGNPGSTGVWGTNWSFWQYTNQSSVSGISGAVDADLFNGDSNGLSAFAIASQQSTIPTVQTQSATSITSTSATINGLITNNGGASIDEERFYWGLSSSCSDGWTNSVTSSGNSFSYPLAGLTPSTTYYFKAWAHNSAGSGNGSVLSFATSASSCINECSYSGQTQCNGDWLQKTCGDYNHDSCLEWSSDSYCPYRCNSATNACNPPPCTDECSLGFPQCYNNNTVETCGNYDSDSCLEWGFTSCSSEQSCVEGMCQTTCGLCSGGQTRCVDSSHYQYCVWLYTNCSGWGGDNGGGSSNYCAYGCNFITNSCNSAPIISCYKNSDCGSEGLFGNPYCSGNNLTQNYVAHTCNNPGTLQSFCTSQSFSRVNETCRYGCSNGVCLTPLPDLTVTNLIVQSISGKNVTLAFTIKNNGNATANPVYWMVDTGSGNQIRRTSPIPLGVGNWTRAYMALSYLNSGNYLATVIADPDNLVSESNDSNNELSILVTV